MRDLSRFALLIGTGVFAMAYGWLAEQPVRCKVVESWKSDHPARLRLFWSTRLEGKFDSHEQWVLPLQPGEGSYIFELPPRALALRLDPADEPGDAELRSITLTGPFGYPLASWTRENHFGGWVPQQQISVLDSSDTLKLRLNGREPILVNRQVGRLEFLLFIERWALAFLLGAAAAMLAQRRACPSAGAAKAAAGFRIGRSEALLLAGSLCLCAGLGYLALTVYRREGAARSTWPISGYEMSLVDRLGHLLSDPAKVGGFQITLDPYTGYRPRSGMKNEKITIDENGFRYSGPPLSRPKAAILGGSAAFGYGLRRNEDTIASQLNRTQPDYEFINAGVSGFYSDQELGTMVHRLDPLRPKLYVAIDGWNDISSPGAPEGAYPFFELEKRICELFGAFLPPDDRGSHNALATPRSQEVNTARYLANIERMAAFAGARGARFAVFVQPALGSKKSMTQEENEMFLHWGTDTWAHRPEFREEYGVFARNVLAFCAEKHLECRDLYHASEFTDEKGPLFLDLVHPNAEGARRVAKAVRAVVSAGPPAG